jgi:Ricin-type beta-trefoil lectin domain
MIVNRIKSAALIACAVMGASISLASTAQAASSSATASQRVVANNHSCAFAVANLGFSYWGPNADRSMVWASEGLKLGNAVLLGNKSTTSPVDCFKQQHDDAGGPNFAFQQNESGLCLNVAGNSKSAGAWIILWDCVSTPNEFFSLNTVNGETQLRSLSSGLCIDLGNGFNTYSHVEQKPCSGTRGDIYQEWTRS